MDKYTFNICEATALGLDYYYMATRRLVTPSAGWNSRIRKSALTAASPSGVQNLAKNIS